MSDDSSIGERNEQRFFRRKREYVKALAATVIVTKIPASFVAETKRATNAISLLPSLCKGEPLPVGPNDRLKAFFLIGDELLGSF